MVSLVLHCLNQDGNGHSEGDEDPDDHDESSPEDEEPTGTKALPKSALGKRKSAFAQRKPKGALHWYHIPYYETYAIFRGRTNRGRIRERDRGSRYATARGSCLVMMFARTVHPIQSKYVHISKSRICSTYSTSRHKCCGHCSMYVCTLKAPPAERSRAIIHYPGH
jgi:hypothetical protein